MPTHRSPLARVVVPAAVALALLVTGADGGSASRPAKDGPRFQEVVVIQLGVRDLDRALAFYTEKLGLELEHRLDDLRWAKVKLPIRGLSLGLGEGKEVSGSGTTSVNLAVADADAARAELEARGVPFHGDTLEIPGVVRLADFADPDGNRFRLAGPPKAAR